MCFFLSFKVEDKHLINIKKKNTQHSFSFLVNVSCGYWNLWVLKDYKIFISFSEYIFLGFHLENIEGRNMGYSPNNCSPLRHQRDRVHWP